MQRPLPLPRLRAPAHARGVTGTVRARQVGPKIEREELLQLRNRSAVCGRRRPVAACGRGRSLSDRLVLRQATEQETTIMIDRGLTEREALRSANSTIDEYIGLGSAILTNLQSQRSMLKAGGRAARPPRRDSRRPAGRARSGASWTWPARWACRRASSA